MSAKLKLILDAMAGQIMGLALCDPATNQPIPVYRKKVPRSQVGLDNLPGIYIYRSDAPETYTRMAFGGNDSITYLIYIVIVAVGNQDFESNIYTYDSWRDQIESMFKPPNLPTDPPLLAGVPGCWNLRIVPDVWLPRQQMNINYDYLGLAIEVSVTKTD